MNIIFKPLSEAYFPLLLKWLEMPHVKTWWDPDVKWTRDLIQKKYRTYVKGYKLENGIAKPISAYMIYGDEVPIGYIQIYSAYDFPRSKPLEGLPKRLAAFDIFIGEKDYLNHGIGSKAIKAFLEQYSQSYTHIFADPESKNFAAIRAYENAGFKIIEEQSDTNQIWMLRGKV